MSDIYNNKYSLFVGSKKGYNGFRNNLRINKFTRLINPRKEDIILEIGCNNGLLLKNLTKYSDHVIGADINKQQTKEEFEDKIVCMSATNLAFSSDYFDKVCAFEVIEHISDINKVFSEVFRVLKKNGSFFISFPIEIVRGQAALLDACVIHKNPFCARKLHIHKLNPKKIKKIIKNIPFTHIKSKIMLVPFPSFVMILRK